MVEVDEVSYFLQQLLLLLQRLQLNYDAKMLQPLGDELLQLLVLGLYDALAGGVQEKNQPQQYFEEVFLQQINALHLQK